MLASKKFCSRSQAELLQRLECRNDASQDLRRRLCCIRQECGKIDMALAAGEIAEAADHDARCIELRGDLRDGRALHLYGLGLKASEQALARRLAVDELIARND